MAEAHLNKNNASMANWVPVYFHIPEEFMDIQRGMKFEDLPERKVHVWCRCNNWLSNIEDIDKYGGINQ